MKIWNKIGALLLLCTMALYANEEWKRFEDRSGRISLELPRRWFYKAIDEGPNKQMFVSVEKLASETDQFMTGVSTTFLDNLQPFDHLSDENLMKVLRHLMEKEGAKYNEFSVLSQEIFRISGYRGGMFEISFRITRNDELIQMYQLSLIAQSNLAIITYESPVAKWLDYRDTFLRSIETIKIN